MERNPDVSSDSRSSTPIRRIGSTHSEEEFEAFGRRRLWSLERESNTMRSLDWNNCLSYHSDEPTIETLVLRLLRTSARAAPRNLCRVA